jgi:hypothetical protein
VRAGVSISSSYRPRARGRRRSRRSAPRTGGASSILSPRRRSGPSCV